MDTDDKYCLKVNSDKTANDLIRWWNDVLFDDGRVMVHDVKSYCGIESKLEDLKTYWSFELTTEKFEMCIRRDSHHVKSYWSINLPKPEPIL
nr:MAG TPA: hypothetical protein [Caudoviricetes sp.]